MPFRASRISALIILAILPTGAFSHVHGLTLRTGLWAGALFFVRGFDEWQGSCTEFDL